MVARRELRAEHSPLFHGLALVIGQVKAAFLHDLVEGGKAVVPFFGDLHFVHRRTGQVGVKAVAGKISPDVLRGLDARHRRGGRRDCPTGKMYRRGHRAAQADGAQSQRARLPQTGFCNGK